MAEGKRKEQHGLGCPRAKAEGAFLALAAGDALGWPQEFRNKVIRPKESHISTEFHEWVRRGGSRFYSYEEIIGSGEYSDDTQLMMAVARCRLIASPDWWKALTRTEIPLWTLYARGGGGATKRAANCWVRGVSPWQDQSKKNQSKRNDQYYFEAGGNGVAMRVLPHAVFFAGKADTQNLVQDVILDGLATHGHPRALVGAVAYAYAAWWLLRTKQTMAYAQLIDVLLEEAKVWGTLPIAKDSTKDWLNAANNAFGGDYSKAWQETVSEMRQLLDRVQSELQKGAIADDDAVLKDLGAFGPTKGSGTISVAAALYLVSRYATQPTQAILKAAFAHGVDTDTIAAMAGGLAGCLSGTEWLPKEWFKVQDCDYLKDLANKVARGPDATVERPPNLREFRTTQLKAIRAALAEDHEHGLTIDGIRKGQVVNSAQAVALSKATLAHTWTLQMEDGQTLYITKVGRRAKDDSAPESVTQPTPRDQQATRTATIGGVKLSVRDVACATSFYKKAFGLAPITQRPKFVTFGSLSLVELQYAKNLSEGAVDGNANPTRNRIEIRVDNLENAFIQVKQAGGQIVHEIKKAHWGQQVFHCLDPEGNLLEIVEVTPSQNTKR